MIDWAVRARTVFSQKRDAPTDEADERRDSSPLSVPDERAVEQPKGVSSVSSALDERIHPNQLCAALVKAINQCCAARGDTEANRVALIAECLELSPFEQADMREHFDAETAIWQRAARGGRQ